MFKKIIYLLSGIFAVLFLSACAGTGGVQSGTASAGTVEPEVAVFPQLGHSDYVNSVAFSPDGKYALSGSRDNTLKLWDVATGREIRTFS